MLLVWISGVFIRSSGIAMDIRWKGGYDFTQVAVLIFLGLLFTCAFKSYIYKFVYCELKL